MDFRAVVHYNPNSATFAQGKIAPGDIAHCRIMLVWDNVPTYQGTTNPSTGVPTLNDNPLSWNHLLSQNPSTMTNPSLSCASYNHDLVTRDHRVSILFDRKFDMVAGTDRSVLRFSCKKSWLAQKLKYLSADNKVINRQLKLCFMSNRPTGECPNLYCVIKCIYTDP